MTIGTMNMAPASAMRTAVRSVRCLALVLFLHLRHVRCQVAREPAVVGLEALRLRRLRLAVIVFVEYGIRIFLIS